MNRCQKEKAKNDYYREKSELYVSKKSKVWSLVNEITNYKWKSKTNIKAVGGVPGQKNKLGLFCIITTELEIGKVPGTFSKSHFLGWSG